MWTDIPLSQAGQLVGIGFLFAVILGVLIVMPLIRRRYERRLQASKDQFVALASHYLLTPITIIQTAVTRLQEADTTLTLEDRQKLYEAIYRGQQRLWIIAEQIVLIHEIENEDLELHLTVGNMGDIVSSAVAAMDIFIRQKGIKLQVTDETKEVQETRMDQRRLKQAFIAILDNAIKFSPEGADIAVRIWQRGNYFTVEIEDHGIGMSEEVISHLSDKFYRGSDIYKFDYEGIGVGLHIAYAILRAHRGVVTFHSKEKHGTVASVELPTS